MSKRHFLAASAIALSLLSLSAHAAFAKEVEINFMQINDVYEIAPAAKGTIGGMARYATLRKELLRSNPNLVSFLAGDFISPSALGTAQVDGTPIAGKQMVDVLNQVGMDYVTFGNHEFDYSKPQPLADCMKMSKFKWISSNVRDLQGQPYNGALENDVIEVPQPDGKSVRIGVFGLTIDSSKRSYVRYLDPFETAKAQVQSLKSKNVDMIVAITHLFLGDDALLAERVPGISLIIGGHEHENHYFRSKSGETVVAKADENAVSIYVHHVRIDTASHKVRVESELRQSDTSIAEDSETKAKVEQWVKTAYDGFRGQGFAPENVVAKTKETLDGREKIVRSQPTNLSDIIARSQLRAVPGAELAIFNTGSIRIDDKVEAGDVTEYDILRILPFGGKVVGVDLTGKYILQTLERCAKLRGTGDFVATAGISFDEKAKCWTVNGKPLNLDQTYRVALTDYLVSGGSKSTDGLNASAMDPKSVFTGIDVRKALIEELKASNR